MTAHSDRQHMAANDRARDVVADLLDDTARANRGLPDAETAGASMQLRILAAAAAEYAERLPGLVHRLVLDGADRHDVSWMTPFTSAGHVRGQWLQWVEDSGGAVKHTTSSIEEFRRVAEVLDVATELDLLIADNPHLKNLKE